MTEQFFARVLPGVGPFTLLSGATGPDGKLIEARHWNGIKTHADLAREVQRLSMQPLNVFFAVGSYASANRKDPIAKRAIWLDLDGKDFAGGTDQAVRELGAFVKATGLPRPSIYVASGRGVHVYWALDRDVPVAEWKPVAEALKLKCAELKFNADASSTSDPARILRAPGSLNRKGELPIPCSVITDTGTTHSLESITNQLQVAPRLRGAAAKLSALASNDDLVSRKDHEQKTAEQVCSMLEHINLPQFASRDLWITVLCAVQDWSDKSNEGFEIFHDWSSNQPGYVSEEDCFITWQSFEPGGGIGVGTLVKLARDAGWGEPTPVVVPMVYDDPTGITVDGPSFAEQLAQQPAAPIIAPAAAAPQVMTRSRVSPLLIACQHATQAGGKARLEHSDAVHWLANEFVMIMDQDGLFFSMTEGQTMTKTVIDDMLTRFMPLNSNGVPTNASMLMRRYGVVNIVNSQGFWPGQPRIFTEHNKSYVNLYTDPPPMLPPTAQEMAMFSDLWDYLFPRDEDKPFGEYLLKYYAHVVQRPAIKITSAPLMISKEFGTGKTTAMFDIPKALVGDSNAQMVSNKVLRGTFSDFIEGHHFLHFDEVHINGKWDSDDTANSLKNLVTGTKVEVHPKGLKPYNIPNRIFITATSNYEDAMTLPSNDERRWGIYYLNPIRPMTPDQRKKYFATFHNFLESPRGPGVLRYIFNAVPLAGWNPKDAPPITDSKLAMVERSQASEVQVLNDAFKNQYGPFAREVFTNEEVVVWLQSETGKQLPGLTVRAFVQRAVPTSKVIREIRSGKGKTRIWAYANHDKWEYCPVEEIREALKN